MTKLRDPSVIMSRALSAVSRLAPRTLPTLRQATPRLAPASRAALPPMRQATLRPAMPRSALVGGACRAYRGHNSMDDILSASEAWHSLAPDRPLGDEAALRASFDLIDLNGNGKIDAYELKMALRDGPMGKLGSLMISEGEVDSIVAAMIGWADIDDDGEIDFEEYKKIIHAGCDVSDDGAPKRTHG